MVNFENDSTQNKHIFDDMSKKHYEAMMKNVSKDAKKRFEEKPYYLNVRENKNER